MKFVFATLIALLMLAAPATASVGGDADTGAENACPAIQEAFACQSMGMAESSSEDGCWRIDTSTGEVYWTPNCDTDDPNKV